jgi:hypothetical protein
MICTHGIDVEEPCFKCALATPVKYAIAPALGDGIDVPTVTGRLQILGETQRFEEGEPDEVAEAVAAERARCRAIVLKYLAKGRTGNAVLAEIDDG